MDKNQNMHNTLTSAGNGGNGQNNPTKSLQLMRCLPLLTIFYIYNFGPICKDFIYIYIYIKKSCYSGALLVVEQKSYNMLFEIWGSCIYIYIYNMQSPICCYYEQYFYIKHIHHEYAQLDLKVQVVRRNINRISIKNS